MKIADYIRLLLTAILLLFIWQENILAIKISLTLMFIGAELTSFVLRKRI